MGLSEQINSNLPSSYVAHVKLYNTKETLLELHIFTEQIVFHFPLQYPNAHQIVAHRSVNRRKVAKSETKPLAPDQEVEGKEGKISLPGRFE